MYNETYYLIEEAINDWLEENKDKTKQDWNNLDQLVKDELVEKKLNENGYVKGKYLGSGVYNWEKQEENKNEDIIEFKTTENFPKGGKLGELECSYYDLVEIFGEPNAGSDDGKTNGEWWVINTTGEEEYHMAIYDWNEQSDLTQVTHWNIGGSSSKIGMIELKQFIKQSKTNKQKQNNSGTSETNKSRKLS